MKIYLLNPDFNNLGYIDAVANVDDKHDRSTPSHYHWKILKCRMIIFSNSSILACPDKTDVKQVHIIFNKTGDDYDKLNSLFAKFSLMQAGEIKMTTKEIFQMCFHYTMTAKMAPMWNTLQENYLINNRDFLIAKGPQEGVYYNISVNDRNTVINVKAVKINLMISNEECLPGEWIRILPRCVTTLYTFLLEALSVFPTILLFALSLKKAIIDKCYETLPQTSKFKFYKDLRRHWKNIHGYRLPDEECSYYSIQFWRGEPLLYPKLCVIRNFPIVTPVPKPFDKIIVSRFLNCFHNKMATFLGSPLIIQIQDTQHEIDKDHMHDSLSETQAVSLCTPTQHPDSKN